MNRAFWSNVKGVKPIPVLSFHSNCAGCRWEKGPSASPVCRALETTNGDIFYRLICSDWIWPESSGCRLPTTNNPLPSGVCTMEFGINKFYKAKMLTVTLSPCLLCLRWFPAPPPPYPKFLLSGLLLFPILFLCLHLLQAPAVNLWDRSHFRQVPL